MISDKIEWQGAFYGQELTKSKTEVIEYINGWIGAMEDIDYEPNKEPRKPKRNPNAVQVENHWRPEHDLPPEVLRAFKNKESRK